MKVCCSEANRTCVVKNEFEFARCAQCIPGLATLVAKCGKSFRLQQALDHVFCEDPCAIFAHQVQKNLEPQWSDWSVGEQLIVPPTNRRERGNKSRLPTPGGAAHSH